MIQRVLDEEWSDEQRARVVEIDPVPVAAASVAQVHRAKLDDGTTVALKVQRPDAALQVHRDLGDLGFLGEACSTVSER